MSVKDAIAEVLEAGEVTDDTELLGRYGQDHSFVRGSSPELLVRVKMREEIEAVVKVANREGVPLVPVSSGPPRFHGDTVPRKGGAILDLSGMDEIGWIDKSERAAFIEPGVTYGKLMPELAKNGLRLPAPLCPRPNKSVIAACLEREAWTTPKFQWAMTDPLASTEFVLGNGDVLRGGESGTMAGTPEEQRERGHALKDPFGVYMLNIARVCTGAQGSIGICRWASLRCELLPEEENLFVLGADRVGDLMGPADRMMYLKMVDHVFVLNNVNLACLLEKDEAKIRSLVDALPAWVLVFTLGGYGASPKHMLDYKVADLKAEKFGESESLGQVPAEKLQGLIRSPSEEPYWKLRLGGECRSVFFQTSLKKAPVFVDHMREVAERHGFPASSLGIYVQPQHQGNCCHVEFDLYCPSGEGEKVHGCFTEASERMMSAGAFFSRPYGEWADMVYPRYYARAAEILKKVKGVFDPNGVLSPGILCY
jgi:FAD/FMN-containing dehydrogenase